MVGNLTAEKRGYEDFWEDCRNLNGKAAALQSRMLELIDEDAQAFRELMKAWKTTAADQDYAKACAPAQKTVFAVIEVLDILRILREKGNRNVLSDVGIGACCARAALEASRINILVNLRCIRSPEFRKELEAALETLIPEGIRQSEMISKQVEKELR
jgi:formiminotetrahydrofolate cyclodeaminase